MVSSMVIRNKERNRAENGDKGWNGGEGRKSAVLARPHTEVDIMGEKLLWNREVAIFKK